MKRIARHTRKILIPHKSNNYRPYLLRSVGVAAFLFFVLGAMFLSQIHVAILKGSDLLASVLPSFLVDLANADRSANNVGTLKVNPKLVFAAEEKAKDMVSRGYFAHNSPDGVTPWHWIAKAEYDFAYAGENLAVNFDDSALVNDAWMNSPSHRTNILNGKFTEIGIAAIEGEYKGRKTMFVVQMFGTPAAPRALSSAVLTPDGEAGDVKPVEVEKNLKPIITSSVLGESVDQTFLAVEDVNAEPMTTNRAQDEKILEEAPPVGLSDSLAVSPTRLLGYVYLAIGAVLVFAFLAILLVSHDRRKRHLIYISLLLIILVSVYFIYRGLLLSDVVIK